MYRQYWAKNHYPLAKIEIHLSNQITVKILNVLTANNFNFTNIKDFILCLSS